MLTNFMLFIVIFILGIAIFLYIKLIVRIFKKQNYTQIDEIIEELEFKIHRYEIMSEYGDYEAKEKTSILKSELKKARLIKKTLESWK
jgi:hypothetical protein